MKKHRCGDSIALTKGLLIAAWRFCHNELALSVSHSLDKAGLRLPASASCFDKHSRLAGCGPNSNFLFPPLAAVVVVALPRGGFGSPLKVNGFARGSPTRGAVEELATRLRGCTKDSVKI